MPKQTTIESLYRLTVETRLRGSLGSFSEEVVFVWAENEQQARDVCLTHIDKNGFEPRFITSCSAKQAK